MVAPHGSVYNARIMDNSPLKQEIDALIAALGEDLTIARPAAEREVLHKIKALLDLTRAERTRSAHEAWETYLPYAAKRCDQLSRLEEGWEEVLEYFSSENAQFWLDYAAALLENREIAAVPHALDQIIEASRMMKRDRITQVEILLQAIEFAMEINDKKRSVQLYEEAEKVYQKHLVNGAEYTGTGWLPKIKKMGKQLRSLGEKLRRYYHYAESVSISIEADSAEDLERVIEYLQQSLVGKVKITRRSKAVEATEKTIQSRCRARLKITLE